MCGPCGSVGAAVGRENPGTAPQFQPRLTLPLAASGEARCPGPRGRPVCSTRRGERKGSRGTCHRHRLANRFGAEGASDQWCGPQGTLGCSTPGLCSGSRHEGPRSDTGKAEQFSGTPVFRGHRPRYILTKEGAPVVCPTGHCWQEGLDEGGANVETRAPTASLVAGPARRWTVPPTGGRGSPAPSGLPSQLSCPFHPDAASHAGPGKEPPPPRKGAAMPRPLRGPRGCPRTGGPQV